MNPVYTAIVKQEDDWWIGWIEEIPGVNCQEKTHGELINSLRNTLQEALQFKVESQSKTNDHPYQGTTKLKIIFPLRSARILV